MHAEFQFPVALRRDGRQARDVKWRMPGGMKDLVVAPFQTCRVPYIGERLQSWKRGDKLRHLRAKFVQIAAARWICTHIVCGEVCKEFFAHETVQHRIHRTQSFGKTAEVVVAIHLQAARAGQAVRSQARRRCTSIVEGTMIALL